MITNELERAVKSYLTSFVSGFLNDGSGTLVDEGELVISAGINGGGLVNNRNDGSDLPLPEAESIALSEKTRLNFYTSETPGETAITRPCVIIYAEGGPDVDLSGNEDVELEVQVQYSADPTDLDDVPQTKLETLSEEIKSALFWEDIVDKLNVYATENFSAVGLRSRGSSREMEGRVLIHTHRLGLQCAGCDLTGTVTQPV